MADDDDALCFLLGLSLRKIFSQFISFFLNLPNFLNILLFGMKFLVHNF